MLDLQPAAVSFTDRVTRPAPQRRTKRCQTRDPLYGRLAAARVEELKRLPSREWVSAQCTHKVRHKVPNLKRVREREKETQGERERESERERKREGEERWGGGVANVIYFVSLQRIKLHNYMFLLFSFY